MDKPAVLFAHERRGVARAVERVLTLSGFSVVHTSTGQEAEGLLSSRRWAALVVDVALPGVPGYELCAQVQEDAGNPARGADVVVLVASVYRRTAYKRRPSRLYGASDYVELHHLCDQLPAKLLKHLQLASAEPTLEQQAIAREALRVEGDARMNEGSDHNLAALIVSDMVLYNGDTILGAGSLAEAAAAVAGDLQIARDLYAQVEAAEGRSSHHGDPVGDAFARLMQSMGRAKPNERLEGGAP